MKKYDLKSARPALQASGRVCAQLFALAALCAISVAGVLGAPVLPHLLSDHMVLQQGREIHLWGKAEPGESITVMLVGRTAAGIADARGRWDVRLPPLPAGGPYTVTVQGKTTLTLKDVMIGEVWVASGQSNMAFALSEAAGAAEEIPKADYPDIRFYTVPQRIALSPQEDTLPAKWEACAPDVAKRFSAVAYFFARDLHKNLQVPIGVILSAWPGTTIQEWVDRGVLQADPELKPLVDEWDASSSEVKAFAEHPVGFSLEFDDFELIFSPAAPGAGQTVSNFDDGSSRTATGGAWSYDWESAPDTVFELVSPGRGERGWAARVSGRLDGTATSLLFATYKADGSPVDLRSYSGVRFWARGNGAFRFRSLQPSITDYDNYASPVLKASSGWQPVEIRFSDLRQEGWGVVKPLTTGELTGFSLECLTPLEYAPMPVSALYEGMIAPLLPFAFRGAIWYQGESNALAAHQYRRLLPALIQNWRQASGQPEMEFLVVQLPNHGAIPDQPGESAWAELREAQLLTVAHTPHSGIAVTIDVGDPDDVHPHRKAEVGARLARWALGKTYGRPLVYSGPLYDSMRLNGNQITVHFTNAGSGLVAQGSETLQGFAIAGEDRKFHWAKARIEGDMVEVSSPEVPVPVAVRYAWADSPRCNLFNKDGLPASPFRTDDWPGITGGGNASK